MKMLRLLLALLLVSSAAMAAPSRVLDDFSDLAAWQAQGSDGVQSRASAADGGLRLDFDFGGKGGYAFVRRSLPIDLPDNYELSFYVRADAPVNHFEFKLTDSSGDNVWWFQQQNYVFPQQWQLVRIKKRQIAFAWGPTKDRKLAHAERLEFVVSAGSGGGKGSIYLRQLAIRALPPVPATWPQAIARASSALPNAGAALALDGKPASAWISNGGEQKLVIDLGMSREFGGLLLHWQGRRYASRYDVEFSDDATHWHMARRVSDGNGGDDPLRLPESETRYIRLALHVGPSAGYALAEVVLQDLAYGATPNQFLSALATTAPRGLYPRGFSGQQPYWTLVGVDGGGDHSALISEDGALEAKQGGFSLEPFIRDGKRLFNWADVEVSQSLMDGYLPVPSVTWTHRSWTLKVTAAAAGSPASSQLLARYQLTNLEAKAKKLTLVLAARPFQVNAPHQFLNTPGGYSAIKDVQWDGRALTINGSDKVYPLASPAGVALASFDAGLLPAAYATVAPRGRPVQAIHDEAGMASAALSYDITLPPHGSAVLGVVLPMAGEVASPSPLGDPAAWLSARQDQVAADWRARLNHVTLALPPAGQHMADTLRSSLAHMLMTREGDALQPGTRSYRRSWIRDGAMMSEALLRLGQQETAANYLRWYAKYQFDNGKVPCCVDLRGADPVPENDSHGELIFLAAELYRHTQDKAALAAVWPRIEAAANYMETLRQSERTAANRDAARLHLFGLMPASISHEGYSEKPMHSYWDDFWAMRGYKDAADIATILGHTGAAQRLAAQRDEFRHDLYASLDASMRLHGIDYLPGAAEVGDFDPTSSTIALTPGGEQQHLSPETLHATYEKYWKFFRARRDGGKAWDDYTPYELRNVSAFIRLGWRQRASELLDYFYADQRPRAWNQWAEVVGRDPRTPRFLGDMPHGWISSDYIRAALDALAYERDADHALLLAEGVPTAWLAGDGIGLRGLRTPYGPLSYTLAQQGQRVTLRIAAMPQPPPGGLVYTWPWPTAPGATSLDGRPVAWQERQITITSLPAVLSIDGAPF
jgi:hypothetical protein